MKPKPNNASRSEFHLRGIGQARALPICMCIRLIPTEPALLARWWWRRPAWVWAHWPSPITTRYQPLPIARPEAAWWGIELIAGVELTCEYEGRELHILGYFIRDDDAAIARGDGTVRAPAGPSAFAR